MSDRGSTERDASTLKATSEDDMASEEETFFEARSVSEEDIDLDALLSTSSTDQRVVSRLHDDPEIRAMLGIMTTGTATARIMKLLAKMGAGGTGEGSKVAREIAKTLAKTTLGVGGSLAAIPVVLSALGFSSIGPVAGSLAASFQSAFGATSAFSFLQSAAMGGGAFTPLCLVVTIPVGLFLTRNLWLPVVKKAIDSIQGFMHNAVEAIKDWWWSLFG